jgi:DNA-binding NtrC family response regulator
MSGKSGTRFHHQVHEVGRLLDAVTTLGPARVPVLVIGSRGSGVDLLAEALHACSPREARSFVTVRCGLYPAATLERELFGHPNPQSAYVRKRSGEEHSAVENANGGTLFIDQIQNTSSAVQTEILRLATEHEYTEPAEGVSHRADVRVIASAHHDLKERSETGRFRADLYARLSTVTLEIKRGYADKQVFLDVVDFLRTPQHRTGSATDWPPEIQALHEAIGRVPEEEAISAEKILFAALRSIGHEKARLMARRSIDAVASAVEGCIETHEYFGGHLYESLNHQLQRTLIERVMVQCNGAKNIAAEVLGISLALLESKLRDLHLG